jgi:hypothetical protein
MAGDDNAQYPDDELPIDRGEPLPVVRNHRRARRGYGHCHKIHSLRQLFANAAIAASRVAA